MQVYLDRAVRLPLRGREADAVPVEAERGPRQAEQQQQQSLHGVRGV